MPSTSWYRRFVDTCTCTARSASISESCRSRSSYGHLPDLSRNRRRCWCSDKRSNLDQWCSSKTSTIPARRSEARSKGHIWQYCCCIRRCPISIRQSRTRGHRSRLSRDNVQDSCGCNLRCATSHSTELVHAELQTRSDGTTCQRHDHRK